MDYRVLGPIEVHDGERLVDVGPRMPRAVLAVLLLQPGRVVSLDRLIDQLWGDEPPAAATGALQVYVSNLRRALEPDRPKRTPPAVLVTQPPGYALRIDPQAVDAVRFETLLTTGRSQFASGDGAAASQSLRDGLALWRGPAYADLAFEPFVQPEIARLAELRACAAEELMEIRLSLGEHAAAVAELERLAEEDPLRERRWELLALALYRSARQAEALRVLQHARRILADELGIDPGLSLRRLEDDILQQSPALERSVAPAPAPVVAASTASEEPSSESAFVGRDDELALLGACLDAVAAGSGRAVLIAGEPGIGKTSLAEEMTALAAARGMQVAWGRCHEGQAAPAFWPWIQIVRTLADSAPPAAVEQALVTGAEELAQLVPDIKERAGRPLEPLVLLDPEASRTRLYDALVGFVLRLSAVTPTVLVVDDLHWADVPSHQLVQLLASRLSSAPLLLVCTYRDLEADGSDALAGTLGAMARVPALVRIRPSALTTDDVVRLLQRATGGDARPDVVEAIRARTEGNPFFVSELIRLLESRGQLADAGTEAVRDTIPAGVRDVIRLRLGRLPEATVSLLDMAAVAGREFDIDVIAAASGVEEDAAVDLVEPALLVGVVVEDATVLDRYRFSHSLVRETLYDGLSARRRARHHRALAQALQRMGADEGDAVLEVAHHLFAASGGRADDEAYRWALLAADHTLARLAFEQAELELTRAIELARRIHPAPEAARRELTAQARLGALLAMRRGYTAPEVGAAWARASELCEVAEDAPEAFTTRWGVWSYACVRGEFARALTLAADMLARGERTGELRYVVIGHHTLGTTYWHLGRLRESDEHFRRLEDVCRSLTDEFFTGVLADRDPRLGFLMFGGLVRALRGAADAPDQLARGVVTARRLDRPFGIVLVMLVAALSRVLADDRHGAAGFASEGAEVARANGFSQLRAINDVICAWAADNPAAVGDALAVYERTGARIFLHVFHSLLADAEQRAGRPVEALAAVERALAESESTGERFWEAEVRRQHAELLLVVGPGDGAASDAAFERALAVARSQGAERLEVRIAESRRRVGFELNG